MRLFSRTRTPNESSSGKIGERKKGAKLQRSGGEKDRGEEELAVTGVIRGSEKRPVERARTRERDRRHFQKVTEGQRR